jgi:hypothetical protein
MAPVPGPGVVEPDNAAGSRPTVPDPDPQGGNFMHGLIGLSPGGFSETVRSSISSLTRRDHDASATTVSPQPGVALKVGDDASAAPPLSPPAPEPRPRHLLALPPEILLMVLQRLELADIFRLRRTCRQLRALASPHQIRILLGPVQLRMQLLGHCKTCLMYDPFRSSLLQPELPDPGYPLASQCLDCALKARDPRIAVGKKITLANFDTVWVCRWCGYPIVEGGAFGFEQMHRFCYKRYNDVLLVFFVLGWLQLGLGIVAAALAWRYYRNSVLVFAPTVVSSVVQPLSRSLAITMMLIELFLQTNFILLWICLMFLIWRGKKLRTYHWTLALELIILGIWIPPVYHVASEIANAPGAPVSKSTQATLAMFALNM